ncbi:MAG: helix-turn-helix domain-containing protein [Ferruginibacter sp.]
MQKTLFNAYYPMTSFNSNNIFKLALKFINETGKSVFLTGKAGTGKTTFLNTLKQNTFKKTAIVAPTGIAAINANGITIHSFFNLPFGPFIPGKNQIESSIDSSKRKLFLELELLVIDEVSMLRGDTLDAIDYILRITRRKEDAPFGGVQVLYVGDPYQLPPIIADDEWQQIKQYYSGINFWNAIVFKKSSPVLLELKQVYRQSDDTFIELLNKVRSGNCFQSEIDLINSNYKPNSLHENSFVVITTHNTKVDSINENELKNLDSDEHCLWAEVDGDFDEASFPAENCLKLKTGAKVMLLRNDKGKDKKYYNGKTGILKKVETEKLSILLEDGAMMEIEKEVWSKINYQYNESSNAINPVVVGTFRQFPIRLAWAITIHKSQGLTFENAVIDLESVFTPGQVYVALSRVKSLKGVILSSLITHQVINNSVFVSSDFLVPLSEDILNKLFVSEQSLFVKRTLQDYFRWLEISNMVSQNQDLLNNYAVLSNTIERVKKCITTSLKFQQEISSICDLKQDDKFQLLQKRVFSAVSYYLAEIDTGIMPIVKAEHSKTKNSVTLKLLFRFNTELKKLLEKKRTSLLAAEKFINDFIAQVNDANENYSFLQKSITEIHGSFETKVTDNNTRDNGNTTILKMFKHGKSISEIAQEKKLNISAIENQLAGFIPTGEVNVHELIPKEVCKDLLSLIENRNSFSSIKKQLGDKVTYGQINAAKIYYEMLQGK